MFDHLGITVTDLDRSREFYTRVLASLGFKKLRDYPGAAVGYGPVTKSGPNAQFWIAKGSAPPSGPRIHVAFSTDRAGVHAFHTAALANGAVDNGGPGLRPQYHEHYYGAFVLDPDGYNIEAVCHAPPASPVKRAAAKRRAAPKPAKRAAAKRTRPSKPAKRPKKARR